MRIFTAEQQQIQSFLSFPSFNFVARTVAPLGGKHPLPSQQRNSQIRPVQLINESTAYNIWAIPCISGRNNFVHKRVTLLSFLLLTESKDNLGYFYDSYETGSSASLTISKEHIPGSHTGSRLRPSQLPIVLLHSPKAFHYGTISCHLATELYNREKTQKRE